MAREPAPNRLTLSHVVRRRADVGAIIRDGEAVLCEPTRLGSHRLDPIATVVWESLDGTVSLRELSADLAAAFGADRRMVEQDVHRLVSDFYDARLLEYDRKISARGEAPAAPPEPERAGEIRYVAVPPST
jgi:hypothetical protein